MYAMEMEMGAPRFPVSELYQRPRSNMMLHECESLVIRIHLSVFVAEKEKLFAKRPSDHPRNVAFTMNRSKA